MNSAPPANGFTLTDMLAAMLILGLALAGLGQGMFALARLQGATNRTAQAASQARAADAALDRLLGAASPEGLAGDARSLTAPCNPSECSIRLEEPSGAAPILHLDARGATLTITLPQGAAPRLVFLSDGGPVSAWPTPNRRLMGVQIEGADGRVLAYHRIWRQQSLDCAFDPVSRRCPTSP